MWKGYSIAKSGSVSLSVLLLAMKLHEDAISECMSKICDGAQEWKVEFWKSEKSLNECRIEFTESSLPRGDFLFVCLVLLIFFITKITSNGRASS